jgi:LPXTG-motif cell wall-anchored protein
LSYYITIDACGATFLIFIKKGDGMYGRGAGSVVTTAGVALLPDTGSSNKILVLAASLVLVGVAILVVSTVMAHKSRNEA